LKFSNQENVEIEDSNYKFQSTYVAFRDEPKQELIKESPKQVKIEEIKIAIVDPIEIKEEVKKEEEEKKSPFLLKMNNTGPTNQLKSNKFGISMCFVCVE
jgi:hypothetical protein